MIKLLATSVLLASVSFMAIAGDKEKTSDDGLVSYESSYSVKETADRFEKIIKSKGLTLFARIDHQKNAAGVDLELRPTEVILFGNPKVGTPLMQCAQNAAIDLPQKVLISEAENKQVSVSFNDPSYIQKRHSIEGCDELVTKISGVLNNLSKAAVAKE